VNHSMFKRVPTRTMVAVLTLAGCIAGVSMVQAAPRDTEERWQLHHKTAELYESTLVPPVFDPWAVDLLERVAPLSGKRVLDVATGTGIVARRVAPLVGPTGTVVGLDLSPGMLAVARAQGRGLSIEWVEGNAQDLPFNEGSFDVALIQQGLQFFPNPAKAALELYRVLRPEGQVGISVWLGVDHNPYGKALPEALDRHIDPKAGAGMRAPFVDQAVTLLDTVLRHANFRDVRIDVVRHNMHVASPGDFVRQHLGSLPFSATIAEKGEAAREAVVRDVLKALSAYETAMGWVVPWASAVAIGRK
jgi:SAM-dependent methyltransferase